MTRVIYGKIGRSMILDPLKYGPVGGDNEPLTLLLQLAERHPDTEFVVGCRWSGKEAAISNLPPNVTLPPIPKVTPRNTYKDGKRTFDITQRPWESFTEVLHPYFENADGVIMWAGQMGTSNIPIPRVEDPSDFTNPQDAFMTYVGPITLNINDWRDVDPGREEIWLCADPRNYLKARDLKWPPAPVVAQYDETREQKHYRWGDVTSPSDLDYPGVRWDDVPGSNVWAAPHVYRYEALELVGVPEDWNQNLWRSFEDRESFGILINEARSYVGLDRASIVRDWVSGRKLLRSDDAIAGKWTDAGMTKAQLFDVNPLLHGTIPDFLGRFKTTFTTPSSGSRWATTKWWEAAALGVVCFCHPEWDAQGHVVPSLAAVDAGVWDHNAAIKHLTQWLRPRTPEELELRVNHVSQSRETYEWLRDMQYALLQVARGDCRAIRAIEKRIPAWSA